METMIVGASEATNEDGGKDTLAVGSKTARDDAMLQQSRQIVVELQKNLGLIYRMLRSQLLDPK